MMENKVDRRRGEEGKLGKREIKVFKRKGREEGEKV